MNKVFKDNPSLQEFFQTADGRPFYSENAAKNHAKTLGEGKRQVTLVEREVENEESEEDENPAPAEYDMSMTRAQLDAVAKGFEIETKELANKQEVIDAIDAFVNGVTSKDLVDPEESAEKVDEDAGTESEEKEASENEEEKTDAPVKDAKDISDKGAEAVETPKKK